MKLDPQFLKSLNRKELSLLFTLLLKNPVLQEIILDSIFKGSLLLLILFLLKKNLSQKEFFLFFNSFFKEKISPEGTVVQNLSLLELENTELEEKKVIPEETVEERFERIFQEKLKERIKNDQKNKK